MNAPILKPKFGPSLSETCPPFAEKLKQYGRLMETQPEEAERVFAEAQSIAAAWRAGVEYGARRR